jgi:heat shock protein 4
LTDPEYTILRNLGHSTFQVSVVSYIQGNLRVKAATVGRNLGSRDFDLALANKLGEQFAFAEKFKAWPRPTSTPSASPTTRTSTTPCPSST